ncbi:MAG: hypothetical protein WCV50_05940 [Patescibacteria group bacterium]
MKFDMARAWAKHQIRAIGVNYFTMGENIDGVSSRFIRTAKQYQSWLGGYLVKYRDRKKFTLQDHFSLAVADQKNWLGHFGDPEPHYSMPAEASLPPQPFSIEPYQGQLYEFTGGLSHSDVGHRNNSLYIRFRMAIMARMFTLSNPDLRLTSRNFTPPITSSDYEMVILKGYVAVMTIEPTIFLVLYGNGAVIKDLTGDHDYFQELRSDILTAFKSVQIDKA